MNSNTRGGARPKQREDDGRLNNRPSSHPGRKPQSFTLKQGDKFFVATKDADGNPVDDSQLWTVSAIERNLLTITSDNGTTIRLHR